MVYASRLVGGFCSSGAFIVAPIYISESVMPKWKGTLGGLVGFFVKLGVIFSFVFGSYTSYLTLNIISGSFTILFLIAYPFLPESPIYLIKKHKISEAQKAYEKLWGSDNKLLISEEIEKCSKNNEKSNDDNAFQILKQFLTKRHLRKACIIVLAVFSFQMFSGYPAIIRYTVDIFQKAGTTYSPHIAAIFVAISQLCFSFLGALLLDKIGRKGFVVYALGLMGTSLAILSLYLHLKSSYPENGIVYSLRLLPTVCLVCFIGFYAAAFGTVPFVIIPELFSPDTRAVASSSLNLCFSVNEFIVVKLFPTVTNLINLSGSLAILASMGFVGCLFCQIVMFETKGLDFEEIQKRLKGENIESTHDEITPLSKSPLN